MLRSISNKFTSECGSAVVGFALGAPFVLFVFIGFIEISHTSWKTMMMQTQEAMRLMTFSLDESLTSSTEIILQKLDEVAVVHAKGSQWNLWRIKE